MSSLASRVAAAVTGTIVPLTMFFNVLGEARVTSLTNPFGTPNAGFHFKFTLREADKERLKQLGLKIVGAGNLRYWSGSIVDSKTYDYITGLGAEPKTHSK